MWRMNRKKIKPARPSLGYSLILLILWPIITVHTIWLAVRRGGGFRYVAERFGIHAPQMGTRPIWIHAASVGEVSVAALLIREMKNRVSDKSFVITTTTYTGAVQALAVLPEATHVFLPVDYRVFVRRYLNSISPCCAIVVETEIWPNLFYECALREIPLVIANARLSHRTTEQPEWVKKILGNAVKNVDQILARSKLDQDQYVAIGASVETTKVLGNIKFSQPMGEVRPIRLERPYFLAASTHDDEEYQLSRMWMSMPFLKSYLLVIVPRHPERGESIKKRILTTSANVALRSRGESVTGETNIYIADTMGELKEFIHGASVVFVGGSMIERGGHNILEAAAAGKAPIYGESIYNFQSEHELLNTNKASFMVKDYDEMKTTFIELISNQGQLAAYGQRAYEVVMKESDAASRYVDELLKVCDFN